MANNEDGIQSQRVGGGNQQLVIITQLLQMSVNMRHIDEMFLWLSHIIGQRLNVDVMQFWTYQANIHGQYSAELRAAASQNTLFPLHVVNNAQIGEVVRDLLVEQSGANPQPVTNLFSSRQADLLMRYNLHYWASFFLGSSDLLPPPMSSEPTHGAVPTPLAMVVSLFTQQMPHPSLLPTIKRISEHALSVAKNRGLLSRGENLSLDSLAHNRAQPKQFAFNELIPQWASDVQAMQADNPFAEAVVISDKRARQLYFSIDGKKSIAELAESNRMDQQEFNSALQILLKQKHIRLHDPNGKAVDSSRFFEHL
jgi:hypothetical protein